MSGEDSGWYIIEGKAKYWDGETWRKNKFNQPPGEYQLQNGAMRWDGTDWHELESEEINVANEVLSELAGNVQFWEDHSQQILKRMELLNNPKTLKKHRRREIVASAFFWYGLITFVISLFSESISFTKGVIALAVSLLISKLITPKRF